MKSLVKNYTVESLYFENSEKIYNLAFQMTGDEELSNDILQETFIKVIENIDKFRHESSYYTWIYKIAKNICLSKLNKRQHQSIKNIEFLIEKESIKLGKNIYNELEKQFYINQVKDGCLLGVLRCLSFYQRIAFILNTILDISVNDVSCIIEKSENATRILIFRAKKIIKGFLCKNCSLYESSNKCKCENLISFSLSENWIEKYNPSVLPKNIELEIKSLKDKILMYKTIIPKGNDCNLTAIIKEYINESKFNIFFDKKVK